MQKRLVLKLFLSSPLSYFFLIFSALSGLVAVSVAPLVPGDLVLAASQTSQPRNSVITAIWYWHLTLQWNHKKSWRDHKRAWVDKGPTENTASKHIKYLSFWLNIKNSSIVRERMLSSYFMSMIKRRKDYRGCKSDRGIRATRKDSIMLLYDRDIIAIARLLYYEEQYQVSR